MPSSPPEYKTGDTFPPISGVARDESGNPVDIHLAESARFVAKGKGPTPATISGAVTIVDDGTVPLRGKYTYNWAPTDLSVADTYEAELEVTWTTVPLKIQTFPSNKANNPTFIVTADLD
jgi:hypothetical protein